MNLARSQVDVLKRSAHALNAAEVAKYFELKAELARPSMKDRRQFERDYCQFYGLNIAGLTEEFLREYFDALYAAAPSSAGWPDYAGLLLKLHAFPNRKDKKTLQSSFVSKLVASKDESWPLYDRHVGNFFGLFIPNVGSVAFRTQILVAHLEFIRERYVAWAGNELSAELKRLRTRIPQLAGCNDVRVCDFLVWRAGNKKLMDAVQ